MVDAVGLLQQVGFGEYEARAYQALLQRSPLNGYELAKLSGLPRANVYGVLQKLEERHAVVRVDTPDGVRYVPVPPHELLGRLGNHFQDALHQALYTLDGLARPSEPNYVWNTHGYAALLDHAHALIDGADASLLIALHPAESAQLAGALARAEARGVQITAHCLAGCPTPCDACRGRIHRYSVAANGMARWLIVIPDGSEVLAGEITGEQDALMVRTRQGLLVDLCALYIRYSVALAALLGDMGGRLGEVLTPETLSLLSEVAPPAGETGSLEDIRQVMGESNELS